MKTQAETNKYIFKPYSSLFPKLFKEEKKRIADHLKTPFLIEHVGSTAIPELGGKGIIDIAIAVPQQEMEISLKAIQDLGYEYRPAFSTPDRSYLIGYLPDPEEGQRRYHIHLTYLASIPWKELVEFRDYLRCHPEEVRQYALLKEHAAKIANQDGETYRKLKEPMIQRILRVSQESSGADR